MFIAATTSANTIAAMSERPFAGGAALGFKKVPDGPGQKATKPGELNQCAPAPSTNTARRGQRKVGRTRVRRRYYAPAWGCHDRFVEPPREVVVDDSGGRAHGLPFKV
jgi:hypothetical protein